MITHGDLHTQQETQARDDHIRAFLDGTAETEFSSEGKDEFYNRIGARLVRFRYFSLGRTERGLILHHLKWVSGYSRQTITG